MPPDCARAFAPGRVNLIGEHTDYNGGLALPFSISQGIVVAAQASSERSVRVRAVDFDEEDAFALEDRARVDGWRAFVRGTVAELSDAGTALPGASLQIGGDLPRGAGLSSSAALEVSLCLALLALSGERVEALAEARAPGDDRAGVAAPAAGARRLEIARLCARVENDWVGAQTGLLDQLASLFGRRDTALRIDFQTLDIEPVPLALGDWRLVVLDSGQRHTHSGGDYNQRRAESARACELLGVSSLSQAGAEGVEGLPEPLRRRARHVLGENQRVLAAVGALRDGDMPALGRLLDASHASLRDDFEISTPAVEAAVARLRDARAAGARIMGGGFGGCVLGLFAPGAQPPQDAIEVRPGPGAHLLGDARETAGTGA
ncbi:MAG: galactokinase [Solirubrobacteraceae bacterium]|nr:galactokinase [Solirubrobacteraceae bacterium]